MISLSYIEPPATALLIPNHIFPIVANVPLRKQISNFSMNYKSCAKEQIAKEKIITPFFEI